MKFAADLHFLTPVQKHLSACTSSGNINLENIPQRNMARCPRWVLVLPVCGLGPHWSLIDIHCLYFVYSELTMTINV